MRRQYADVLIETFCEIAKVFIEAIAIDVFIEDVDGHIRQSVPEYRATSSQTD